MPSRVTVLLGVLAIGAALRLHHIDQPFVDFHGWRESSTAMMAENIYRGGSLFYPEINWDGAGPGYNGREFQLVTFIAASIYKVTGQVDWVGRLVSVMFGVWGIFALFKLIAIVWDHRRALAGAAILAVLPGAIFIDREFLPDPAMVALMTTGCWLTFEYLSTGRRRDLLWGAVALALGVLTKLTGLCLAIALAYVVLRTESSERRAVAVRVGLLTLVPVAVYYGWAVYLSKTYPPFHFAGSQGFIWSSSVGAGWASGYLVSGLWRELGNAWTWIGALLIVAALPMLAARPGRSTWFFHWWLLGAGVVYFAIGASHLVWQPYNLHLFNPPAAALAGYAAVAFADAAQKFIGVTAARVSMALVIAAIALAGIPFLRSAYGPHASAGHQMGMALRDATQPNDLIVTIPEYAGDPVALYYARRHGWVFPPAEVWSAIPENWDQAIVGPGAAEWLDRLRVRGARWLAIVSAQRDRLWAQNPAFAAYVQRHFTPHSETSAYVIFRERVY